LWGQCGGKGYDGPSECCNQTAACEHKPLKHLPSYHQCRTKKPLPCGEAWDQCGGEGFTGSTCCKEGLECRRKPLPNLPSFAQCMEPACEDPLPGSVCHERVMFDKTTGIFQDTAWYRGLSKDMGFKEFQEYESRWNREESQCKPPCADGTCFVVFRYEGCDTMNKWTCEVDDGSLAFACCCKYFHDRVHEAKPEPISGDMSRAIQAASSEEAVSLFCVALCFPVGYELGLLRAQYALGKHGVFSCNTWSVYSNRTLRLSAANATPIARTGVINGSLDAKVGGKYGTALNTDVFVRFWNKVSKDPKAWKANWIVKLDPDTLFLPGRFRALVSSEPLNGHEPEHGWWLNNCHLGMHGPIEVLSRAALATYSKGWESCVNGSAGEHGQEDVYLRVCLNELGVQQVDAFNLLYEAKLACQERPASWNPYRPPCFAAQVAFHPFKSITSYMHCYQEAARHPWALPTGLVSIPPSPENEWHA